MISPDAPILNSSEDILARTPFAASLAKAISGVAGADSFVIGIHGRWGSGKSSVLNLVAEQLSELNKSRPEQDQSHVLRFNPWNFSDQSQLVFQFLKQFRAHLLESEKRTGEKLGKMAAAIADYAEALSPPLELLPYGSLWSSGLKVVARGVKKTFGAPSDKDVNTVFEELSKEASKLKRRTVVFIDDIDRLTAAETRQIFQLVKLTARFPYVVYVLAFDRTAVADALGGVSIGSGGEYLEKIVQVSFDLPPITDATMTLLITQGIDEMLKKFNPPHFDQIRFGNLFHGGFRRSFTSLRHVRRFLNGLEFALSIVGSELNAVDIIGVEALRVFYPKTYEAVRNGREIFAGHIDTITRDRGAGAYTKDADAVLKSTGEFSETLKDMLLELFPKLNYAYGNMNYGHESETAWEKTHRVGTTRYFDAYFQFALAPSEVSVAEVARLIEATGDEVKLTQHLLDLARKGKVKHAMESLRFRLSEVPDLNLRDLLCALIQLGDKVSDDGSPLAGVISEFWHVRWVIFDVLDKLQPETRPDTLLVIAKTRFAPKTLLNVIIMVGQLRSENSKYPEFTDDRINGIQAALVKSIEDAAGRDAISVKDDALPAIIHIWTTWGKAENARLYLGRVARSDIEILELTNRFIYQSHSYGGGDRVGRTHNKLAMAGLSRALDLNDLLNRLKGIDASTLDSEHREVQRIAVQQLTKMREQNMTAEQFDSSRFFDDE